MMSFKGITFVPVQLLEENQEDPTSIGELKEPVQGAGLQH